MAAAHDPLRPGLLREFTGQPKASAELGVILSGAKSRSELAPHLLFAGPPGLGKTTLAGIVAAELELPLVSTTGPAVERPGDLAGLLVALERPSVVFIDEVHRLPPAVEEMLYTAMEDRRIDVLIGEGPGKSRSIPMPLEDFVLVGATTRAGMLGGPFRDRFGHIVRLDLYDTEALSRIIKRSADLLDTRITDDAATAIASRSRGTPRIANKWLRRVRDFVATMPRRGDRIDLKRVNDALELFGVDAAGLDHVDRAILAAICEMFSGGPVGVGTLAAAVGEEPGTLEEMYEPYLMRQGFISRTPRGRVATAGAYRHLHLPVPSRLADDAA